MIHLLKTACVPHFTHRKSQNSQYGIQISKQCFLNFAPCDPAALIFLLVLELATCMTASVLFMSCLRTHGTVKLTFHLLQVPDQTSHFQGSLSSLRNYHHPPPNMPHSLFLLYSFSTITSWYAKKFNFYLFPPQNTSHYNIGIYLRISLF